MTRSTRLGKSKKGFISDFLVDFWAIIIFIVVIFVFAIIYKFSATSVDEKIADIRDITYGNYIAQAYLKTPVNAGGQEMTMAELITLYDHQQSTEKDKDEQYADLIIREQNLIRGNDTDLLEIILKLTDEFLETNMPEEKCYFFAIHGEAFDINHKSQYCSPEIDQLNIHYLAEVTDIPSGVFATYIAPIDPRSSPVVIYSIYDLERLLDLYLGEDKTRLWEYSRTIQDKEECINDPAQCPVITQ